MGGSWWGGGAVRGRSTLIYLLDMTQLAVWIKTGAGGNKADCWAVTEFVVVSALHPCGWCWGAGKTRSQSSFSGGVLYLSPSFFIQKVHC